MAKKSETSSFGTVTRKNHDSDIYYSSKMNLQFDKNYNRKPDMNRNEIMTPDTIFHGDSRDMSAIPDNSVHLTITSPPYNVGKDGYEDNRTLEEYEEFLYQTFLELYRVGIDGNRTIFNVANLGRKPYLSVANLITDIATSVGFFKRAEVIWDKSASAGLSFAWGSYMRASNPCMRDIHEYILIFSKGTRQREQGKSTISKDEFATYTKSIWRFQTAKAKKIGHPSPFPVELPYRCIQLYSFEGDVVLDPFMGSGQTGIASVRTKRRYLGYDNNIEYVELARQRIQKYQEYQDKNK